MQQPRLSENTLHDSVINNFSKLGSCQEKHVRGEGNFEEYFVLDRNFLSLFCHSLLSVLLFYRLLAKKKRTKTENTSSTNSDVGCFDRGFSLVGNSRISLKYLGYNPKSASNLRYWVVFFQLTQIGLSSDGQ